MKFKITKYDYLFREMKVNVGFTKYYFQITWKIGKYTTFLFVTKLKVSFKQLTIGND